MNLLTNSNLSLVKMVLERIEYYKTRRNLKEVITMWQSPDYIPNNRKMQWCLNNYKNLPVVFISQNNMYKNDWKLIPQLLQRNTIFFFYTKDEERNVIEDYSYIHIKNKKVIKAKHDNDLATIIWKFNEAIKMEEMKYNFMDFQLIEYYTKNMKLSLEQAKTKVFSINKSLSKESFRTKIDGIFSLFNVDLYIPETENKRLARHNLDLYKEKYLHILWFKESQDISTLRTYRANPTPNELESEFENLEVEFRAINAVDRIKKELNLDIDIHDIFEYIEEEFYSTDFIEEMFTLNAHD